MYTVVGLSKTGRLLDFTPWKCPARRCEVITDAVVLDHKIRLLNHLVDSMHIMFTSILHMVMYMNEAVDGRCCRGEILRLVHSLVTAIDVSFEGTVGVLYFTGDCTDGSHNRVSARNVDGRAEGRAHDEVCRTVVHDDTACGDGR